MIVKGLTLISRYDSADELAVMKECAWALSPQERALLSEIFCDSKAEWCFRITPKSRDYEKAGPDVDGYMIAAKRLEACCMRRIGGHNGIDFDFDYSEAAAPFELGLSPIWKGDIED